MTEHHCFMWRDKMTSWQRVSGCDLYWYQLLILCNEDLLTHTDCCRKGKAVISMVMRLNCIEGVRPNSRRNFLVLRTVHCPSWNQDTSYTCPSPPGYSQWMPAGEAALPLVAVGMGRWGEGRACRRHASEGKCTAVNLSGHQGVLGSCCSKGSRSRIIEYPNWKGLLRIKSNSWLCMASPKPDVWEWWSNTPWAVGLGPCPLPWAVCSVPTALWGQSLIQPHPPLIGRHHKSQKFVLLLGARCWFSFVQGAIMKHGAGQSAKTGGSLSFGQVVSTVSNRWVCPMDVFALKHEREWAWNWNFWQNPPSVWRRCLGRFPQPLGQGRSYRAQTPATQEAPWLF